MLIVAEDAMQAWKTKHADGDVAKRFKPGELEKLCSLDFRFKAVKNRFKKLGL
jgi:hypothetical protein